MAEPPLIRALRRPALHGGEAAALVETHISWVLLGPAFAYKIKKPVDFGFLDFTALAARRHYCQEEVRLNRRLAPELYLGVAAVTGDLENPAFDGAGPVLEYAVKLRRFDEGRLADRLLARGLLEPAWLDRLAQEIAAFHAAAPRSAPGDRHGLPGDVLAAARHNFDHLRRVLPGHAPRWDGLEDWTLAEFARLAGVFAARKAQGFVRECHGDLHCGNLVLLDGRLAAFDCIEFSEDLRWIDCLSEAAFLAMDLEARGRADLAWRWLNAYLQAGGDYAGLPVLNFYRAYRALVRAKIAALALEQGGGAELEAQALAYAALAEQAARAPAPALLITHGLSGSGKSRRAAALAERLPAVRIASDVERKRLAGLPALAKSGGGLYTEEATLQTYARLLELAEAALLAGFSVILDATFLRKSQREAARELAGRLGLRFFILDCGADEAVLRERIARRQAAGDDPSEAGQEVLTRQMAEAEALDGGEARLAIPAGQAAEADPALLAAAGARTES